jgi:hypothetical protein
MSAGTFTSFAYGSNMLAARLRARCPSAQPLSVAALKGFELRWHKRSNDGSGKCDIVASNRPEAHVSGVLYQIANSEKAALDQAEGLGQGYKEIDVQVFCAGLEVTSKAYQATNIDETLKPYSWYRALVVAGAREHRHSPDYIARLEAVPAIEDTNRDRHERNMRLIPEGLA